MHRFNSLAAVMLLSALGISACSKSDQAPVSSEITATTPVSGQASTLTERKAQQRAISALQANLDKAGIKAKVLNMRPTELSGMYWVTLEGLPSVFATADGKYIFQGDVARLGDKKIHHISEDLQAVDNKARFAALKPQDLIIYSAQGTARHVIYVFTDASCPYCHKLHANIPAMTAKGIEVRYIAWPRGDQFSPAMQSIWCSPDRKAAFDQAVKGMPLPPAQCANPVMEQYQLGVTIGVNGTPAIYNQDGHYIAGYIEPDELVSRLDELSSASAR